LICSAVSGGRVLLRPDGSPIMLVKSPIKKITVCPRSCKLAHFVEHHRVADMDVGSGRVQPELDPQRLAGGLGPAPAF